MGHAERINREGKRKRPIETHRVGLDDGTIEDFCWFRDKVEQKCICNAGHAGYIPKRRWNSMDDVKAAEAINRTLAVTLLQSEVSPWSKTRHRQSAFKSEEQLQYVLQVIEQIREYLLNEVMAGLKQEAHIHLMKLLPVKCLVNQSLN